MYQMDRRMKTDFYNGLSPSSKYQSRVNLYSNLSPKISPGLSPKLKQRVEYVNQKSISDDMAYKNYQSRITGEPNRSKSKKYKNGLTQTNTSKRMDTNVFYNRNVRTATDQN